VLKVRGWDEISQTGLAIVVGKERKEFFRISDPWDILFSAGTETFCCHAATMGKLF
jgi:hypothetical protein